jgi:hypothetical protein|mmetsp:Transcript_88236/g.146668  ORF Transcript_88236/g.146668 Transcript_88236/m.146668 type:complete len:235 (+) Transcript_88236:256-960(+)
MKCHPWVLTTACHMFLGLKSQPGVREGGNCGRKSNHCAQFGEHSCRRACRMHQVPVTADTRLVNTMHTDNPDCHLKSDAGGDTNRGMQICHTSSPSFPHRLCPRLPWRSSVNLCPSAVQRFFKANQTSAFLSPYRSPGSQVLRPTRTSCPSPPSPTAQQTGEKCTAGQRMASGTPFSKHKGHKMVVPGCVIIAKRRCRTHGPIPRACVQQRVLMEASTSERQGPSFPQLPYQGL